jgi:hypothetical protein
MHLRSKRAVAGLAAIGVMAAGGGAAVAATTGSGSSNASGGSAGAAQVPALPVPPPGLPGLPVARPADAAKFGKAFIDDLAKRLGVTPSKLVSEAKAAAVDQVNAALSAGRITKAQADALRQRIESGRFPLVGPGRLMVRPGIGVRDALDAAASYLGVSQSDLRSKLQSGQSLASIATSEGKSVDGLKTAILDAVKKDLDRAVSAGKITSAQEQRILSRLQARIGNLVNRTPHAGARFPGAVGPPPGAAGPPPVPGMGL